MKKNMLKVDMKRKVEIKNLILRYKASFERDFELCKEANSSPYQVEKEPKQLHTNRSWYKSAHLDYSWVVP